MCALQQPEAAPCDVWGLLMCSVGLVLQGIFQNLTDLNSNVIVSKTSESYSVCASLSHVAVLSLCKERGWCWWDQNGDKLKRILNNSEG